MISMVDAPTVNDFLDLLRMQSEVALRSFKRRVVDIQAEAISIGRFNSDIMFSNLADAAERIFKEHAVSVVRELDRTRSDVRFNPSELQELAQQHLHQVLLAFRGVAGVDIPEGAKRTDLFGTVEGRIQTLEEYLAVMMRQQAIDWTRRHDENDGDRKAVEAGAAGETLQASGVGEARRRHNDLSPPSSPSPEGRALFDYAAHDGRHVIGSGEWAFETRWSRSGPTSIHTYGDAPSVSGVALAYGISDISEITPEVVGTLDFTSRTRSPNVGEVVVLENRNGYIAAVKVLSIPVADVARGASPDLLEIEYRILADLSRDFTKSHSEVFELYGDAATAISIARELGDDLQQRWQPPAPGPAHGGLGHNHPPEEMPVSVEEHQAVREALATVRVEFAKPTPSKDALGNAYATLKKAAASVSKWVGVRLEKLTDAFVEEVGKELADYKLWLAGWLLWSGHADQLAALIFRFLGGG